MKDHNDFFDEMIDVDDEGEREGEELLEEEGYGDDEEENEDDDDLNVVRTAILRKNDMLALISLSAGDAGGRIVRYDPREALPAVQRYESEAEAQKWFRRSLATSKRNGWAVVFDGEPMLG